MRSTLSIAAVDPRPSPAHDRDTLESALQSAIELVRTIEAVPEGTAVARHASYAVARGLAHTLLDMLHEIEGDVRPLPAR